LFGYGRQADFPDHIGVGPPEAQVDKWGRIIKQAGIEPQWADAIPPEASAMCHLGQ